jgi:hypothetical protein
MRIITVVFMAFFLSTISSAQKCQPRGAARVGSIKGMLFYGDTGGFSENVIDNAKFNLFNIGIGEGSAAGPSSNLFVVVEVFGDIRPNRCPSAPDSLTIVTQEQGKPPISRHIKFLNFLGRGGANIEHHFEGFWVYDVRCSALTISAQVNQQTAMRKKVDFTCGE